VLCVLRSVLFVLQCILCVLQRVYCQLIARGNDVTVSTAGDAAVAREL